MVHSFAEIIRSEGLNVSEYLPKLIHCINSEFVFPKKISDLTSKVERKLGANQSSFSQVLEYKGAKVIPSLFVGKQCSSLGIDEVYLINCDDPHNNNKQIAKITNCVIYELYLYKERRNKTWDEMRKWLKCLFQLETEPKTVHNRILKLKKERCAMIKNRLTIDAFMNEEFKIDNGDMQNQKQNENDVSKVSQTNEDLCNNIAQVKSKYEQCFDELIDTEVELFEVNKKCDELILELKREKHKNEKLDENLILIKVKYEKSVHKVGKCLEKLNQYDPKNVAKQIERKELRLVELQTELADLKGKIEGLNSKNTKLQSKTSYLKKQAKRKSIEVVKQHEQIQILESDLKYKNNESDDLLMEVSQLRNEQDLAQLKIGRKYTDKTTTCCMNLLKLGISSRKVGETIRTVLRDISGIEVSENQLPEKSYVNRLSVPMCILSKMQVAEELLGSANGTLLFDGTSRYGDHTLTYNLSTENNSIKTIGMIPVHTENAQTLLNVTENIFDDLATVISNSENEKLENFMNMLSKIKNTMSDRCSVNKAYVKEFETFRSDILPYIQENADSMTEDAVKDVSAINDYYCGYHVTLGWSDVADASLKLFENMVTENDVSIGLATLKEFQTWSVKNSGRYF